MPVAVFLELILTSTSAVLADASSQGKVTAAKNLKMNKKLCSLIFARKIVFNDVHVVIDPVNYPKLRAV